MLSFLTRSDLTSLKTTSKEGQSIVQHFRGDDKELLQKYCLFLDAAVGISANVLMRRVNNKGYTNFTYVNKYYRTYREYLDDPDEKNEENLLAKLIQFGIIKGQVLSDLQIQDDGRLAEYDDTGRLIAQEVRNVDVSPLLPYFNSLANPPPHSPHFHDFLGLIEDVRFNGGRKNNYFLRIPGTYLYALLDESYFPFNKVDDLVSEAKKKLLYLHRNQALCTPGMFQKNLQKIPVTLHFIPPSYMIDALRNYIDTVYKPLLLGEGNDLVEELMQRRRWALDSGYAYVNGQAAVGRNNDRILELEADDRVRRVLDVKNRIRFIENYIQRNSSLGSLLRHKEREKEARKAQRDAFYASAGGGAGAGAAGGGGP